MPVCVPQTGAGSWLVRTQATVTGIRKMKSTINYIIFFAFTLVMNVGYAQPAGTVNWKKFLSRNDMVFDTLTTKWEEGVFTGNGLVGAMLYMKDNNTLRLEIGRTDVTDHRDDSVHELFGKARLPIGHFELKPEGNILKHTARLDLWNAEAVGTIVTSKGTIQWRTLTLSQDNVIIFETHTSSGEKNFHWQFQPEVSISSRTKFNEAPKGYAANPACLLSKEKNVSYCWQPMVAGGDYTTAWTSRDKNTTRTFYISISIHKKHSSVSQAVQTVMLAANADARQLIESHRQWWHQYYQQSFVSIPDARMESFYWIQQYKMASGTRADNPALDLMGPWFRYTPWPAYWFNLNIQLTYSPLFTANRLELVKSFINMIDEGKENLKRNVPEVYRHNALAIGRSSSSDLYRPIKVFSQLDTTASNPELELGNLTWCLYYYWLQYRYTMDESLKENLFPLLKGSINYYIDIMSKGADGKWHLPYTYSPEYPKGVTRDCNYDLSLFRWGCETLLKINPSDSLAPVWKDVLNNLVPYPSDEGGLRIGRDVAFNQSHRHYSHMLMIYPLHLMNWDQEEDRSLIKKSLEHWHSFKGALQGYSFTGGASMYATMGKGDKALDYLDQLLERYIKPNTMYLETGPVIETPLSAAASIQELLLQSWGDKIRIFPAVPSAWKDVSFENLRTEGAFLISAVRKDGKTKWVRIKSLAGQPCIVRPGIDGVIKLKGNGKLTSLGAGLYAVSLHKNEEVVLYQNENDLAFKIVPVAGSGALHSWGTKNTISKTKD